MNIEAVCYDYTNQSSCKKGGCTWVKNSSSGYCRVNCEQFDKSGCSYYKECTFVNKKCKNINSESNSSSMYGYSNDVKNEGQVNFSIDFSGEKYNFGANEGIYCTNDTEKEDFTFPKCIKIYKNFMVHDDYYEAYLFPTNYTNIVFFADDSDRVSTSLGLWWGSILVTKSKTDDNTFQFYWHALTGQSTFSYSAVATTDDLSVYKQKQQKAILGKIIGIDYYDLTEYAVYTPRNIDKENTRFVCPTINEIEKNIDALAELYQKKPNPEYVTDYKESLEEIRSLCASIMDHSSFNEACMQHCVGLNSSITNWNSNFGITSSNNSCGFSDKLINWVLNILKWIKYIIPVAVIVLGMIDFIKATASDKDDEMKKAQGRFIKRLIAAALIFLVPLLVEFILPKLGFDYNSCGLF